MLRTQAYNLAVADIAMVMGTGEAEAEKIYGPGGHNFLGFRTPKYIASHWHRNYSNHDQTKVRARFGLKANTVKITRKK